jgi:hypothetical protein
MCHSVDSDRVLILWEYLICLKNKTLYLPVDFLMGAWYYRQAVRETG